MSVKKGKHLLVYTSFYAIEICAADCNLRGQRWGQYECLDTVTYVQLDPCKNYGFAAMAWPLPLHAWALHDALWLGSVRDLCSLSPTSSSLIHYPSCPKDATIMSAEPQKQGAYTTSERAKGRKGACVEPTLCFYRQRVEWTWWLWGCVVTDNSQKSYIYIYIYIYI